MGIKLVFLKIKLFNFLYKKSNLLKDNVNIVD